MNSLSVSEATLMLAEGIEDAPSESFIESSAVQYCVLNGADVMFQLKNARLPILHTLVYYGLVDCVREALRTSIPIDFRIKTKYGSNTVLHLIASYRHSDAVSLSMTKLIVERLQSFTDDRIDWLQPNDKGYHFFDKAAQCQKLSVLWPVVERVVTPSLIPLAATNISRGKNCTSISLDAGVWCSDWEKLNPDQRRWFTIAPHIPSQSPKGLVQNHDPHRTSNTNANDGGENNTAKPDSVLIHVDPHTECLFRQSRMSVPDIREVRSAVSKGANIMFAALPYSNEPILHNFIRFGHIECIESCLTCTTAACIDFTERDAVGNTPMHYICDGPKKTEEVKTILKMILRRISEHSDDLVDWGAKNNDGYDFLSIAAYFDKLSVVWKILQENKIPFFWRSSDRIPICLPVGWKDFRHLSMEDRLKQFKMVKKFK